MHALKREFPQLSIAINGGIGTAAQIAEQLDPAGAALDGVMVGREAYHNPAVMAGWDARFFGDGARLDADDDWRLGIEQAMVAYMARCQAAQGTPWSHIARHMLGLWNGRPGARRWRQVWSDHRLKAEPAAEVARQALQARAG